MSRIKLACGTFSYIMNYRVPGQTLIEIVIVLAIIGILSVVIVPYVRKTSVQPKEFVAKLNMLMQAAWQQALLTNRVQKIFFDFSGKRIFLFELVERGKTKDTDKFTPTASIYLSTELKIPPGYFFNNFYIEKKDQMRMREQKDAWFFLTPAGLTQEVIINITDRGDGQSERDVERFGLVLNPFSAQFEYYGTFQAP